MKILDILWPGVGASPVKWIAAVAIWICFALAALSLSSYARADLDEGTPRWSWVNATTLVDGSPYDHPTMGAATTIYCLEGDMLPGTMQDRRAVRAGATVILTAPPEATELVTAPETWRVAPYNCVATHMTREGAESVPTEIVPFVFALAPTVPTGLMVR